VNARDVRGPASRVEWESALSLMYAALGLPRRHALSPFIHNIFIDAGELARSAA
jgi:hypothetical protein